MCFEEWLKNATREELARFDRTMAARKERERKQDPSLMLHQRIGDMITNKDIGLRKLALVEAVAQ